MAELADAHGSGPCGSNTMRVQVSFPAWKEALEMRLLFLCVGFHAACFEPPRDRKYVRSHFLLKFRCPGSHRTLHWAYFLGEIPTALVKALKKLL